MNQPQLRYILESLLFVTDEPLTIDKLKGALENVDGKEIRAALLELQAEYAQRDGGFGLYEVAGGWQLRSRPEYNEWIKRFLQPSPQRLSKAALETLALIAYRQPIIRADIEHIRGVDCGGILRQLMERKLIRVLGRKEIAGRPLINATTKTFLELFDLKDLKDLPTPKEIQELGNAYAGVQNRGPAEAGTDTAPEATSMAQEAASVAPAGEPATDGVQFSDFFGTTADEEVKPPSDVLEVLPEIGQAPMDGGTPVPAEDQEDPGEPDWISDSPEDRPAEDR
jgi:segregation and condensation protein B